MGRFFTELRRKRVFHVTAVYAVVAWVLAQAMALVLGTYGAPNWVQPAVLTTLFAGFPAAIVLAWLFELTPEGIQRTSSVRVYGETDGSGSDTLVWAGMFVGALALFAAVLMFSQPSDVEENQLARIEATLLNHDPLKSIAVLPFENLSPDPDNAYFAAGVHEEILNRLTRINELTVIARTSVLGYTGTQKMIPIIADELGVATVMEGSVRYAGNRVRITAQLIDGKSGAHLWSEIFDRDLSDIFSIQSEIAERIAASLQAELVPQRAPTDNVEAYALYLRSARVQGFGPETESRRRQYLEQAIALDPDFAYAHIALALNYTGALISESYALEEGPDDGPQIVGKAREHAELALEIDPTLAMGHVVLARMHSYEWSWEDADREYDLALELGPNQPSVLWQIAFFSRQRANFDRAIAASIRAVELVPNQGQFRGLLGLSLLMGGRAEEARLVYEEGIEMSPTNWSLRVWHATTLRELGMHEESLAELSIVERLLGEDYPPHVLTYVAWEYGQLSMLGEVERIFQILNSVSDDRHIGAIAWARMYRALGDYETALDWLHQAIDTRDDADGAIPHLFHGRGWERVFDHPRYLEARAKLGFV